MNELNKLNKEQLWELRQEIVLNSMFLDDYQNSFGVDKNECFAFFDGYVEELVDKAREDNVNTDNIFDIFELYDNAENLFNYLSTI